MVHISERKWGMERGYPMSSDTARVGSEDCGSHQLKEIVNGFLYNEFERGLVFE